MSSLQGYVDHHVYLVLTDGRSIVGTLRGYDQKANVVLSESVERTYSLDSGVDETPLGLYLVKGDTIVLLGELDEAMDRAVPLDSVRADPIAPVHW